MLKIPNGNLTEFPGRFPEPVERQARRLAREVEFRDELFEDREEVRGFTMDAKDSRDLDDAIWLEPAPYGWIIQVTISDVDALIHRDSYIDFEALSRVISHYFPAHTTSRGKTFPKLIIPMFPKVLSENKLSLLEGKIRPTLTAEILLGHDLTKLGFKVKKTFLRSARRLGLREYGDAKIISDPGLPLRNYLHMAEMLNRKRWAEKSLSFQELGEGLSMDEDSVREGSISAASLIVQEFMVLANQAVAELMHEQKQAVPFRNHIPSRLNPPTREQIIAEVERSSNYLVLVDRIQAAFHKFLAPAIYEPQSKGHYGLGTDHYLHFTSPIRRYPDLVVHRAVKALIDGEAPPYNDDEMSRLCTYLNQRNRRLATLRATRQGTNSLGNYQRSAHLLHHNQLKQPDYVENLLAYLRDNRIGNAYFEFTVSAGIHVTVKCRASVRYQKVLYHVEASGRADKQTLKNKAAKLLLDQIKHLVLTNSPEANPRALSKARSFEPGIVTGSVYNLYSHCEQNDFDRPTFHYEYWNGGAHPISCHCQINDSLSVIGYGDSREESKTKAAQKLLDYLQSGQHISSRRSGDSRRAAIIVAAAGIIDSKNEPSTHPEIASNAAQAKS